MKDFDRPGIIRECRTATDALRNIKNSDNIPQEVLDLSTEAIIAIMKINEFIDLYIFDNLSISDMINERTIFGNDFIKYCESNHPVKLEDGREVVNANAHDFDMMKEALNELLESGKPMHSIVIGDATFNNLDNLD